MTENRSEFRKSIKGPDAFQKRFRGYLEWMRENPQAVALVLAPFVVVIAAYAGLSVWQHTKEERRIDALGQISVVYEEESQAAETRRESLLSALDETRAALSEARAGEEQARVAELEQRERQLNDQIEELVPDRAHSLAQFREFFQENNKYPEGWAAGLMAVAVVLELDQLDEARELLTELLAASRGNDFYQTHARISLIGVLEDLGDFDQALVQADILADKASEIVRPQALLARGRVLILSGRAEEARQTLSQLETEYGDSPEAQQARSLQSLIRG